MTPFRPDPDAEGGSKWGRIRQARAVTVTAQELNREAQEIGSAQVLTLNQLENAANGGQAVQTSRFVLLPTNQAKKAWDLVIVLILAFSAIVVPFRVAFFSTEDPSDPWFITEVVMDCLLLADVFLTFFSAIETDAIVIVDHRTIAWKYVTGWFAVDLVASLPIALFLPNVGQNLRGVRLLRIPRMLKLLKILRLLRVARVLRASKYARTIQRFINLNPAILRLIIFVLAFLLFAHISASFWFLVAELEDFSPDTWVVRYGILDSDRVTQYIASLYFATTLLSTTGLGDVVPLALSEQLFTIFLELAGVTIISYMTSTITGLIGSFDARARRRQDKFEEIERFMGAKALSASLRGTIRDYFELVLASKSTAALDEAKLLGELSGPLQTAVMFEVHGSLIDRFSFFRGKQPEFVRDVLMAATPMVVKHDRLLFREGMTGDALVLLIEGRINFESSQGTVYMQLPPGSVFGAMSLLCTGRNVCDARSVGTVHTYSVPRRDVERILEDYPDVESELLALALARLRRLQVERRKTRSQRLAAGVSAFSPEAEAATDAAVTRGLATKRSMDVADEQLSMGRRRPEPVQGRRASAPVLTAEELASGHAAGSAERIALLRHMTDTKQFRRLSSSAPGQRSGGGGESSGHGEEAGLPAAGPLGRASRAGSGSSRADSKAAAAAASSTAEESVAAAMRGAAASKGERLPGERRAGGGATSARVPASPTLPPAADLTEPSGRSGRGTAQLPGSRGTATAFARTSAAATSGAEASGHGRGSGGAEEGGPEAGSAPRLLDSESRQGSLSGKARSGVALRGPAMASRSNGSRRHSLASADPFDRQLTSSKELELRDQTDSLIERTLTTAKRAVRRKERLVTRMAAERERRQFTSRPMHAVLQSSSPHPDDAAGPRSRRIAPAPVEPPTLLAAGRSQSEALKKRARGLRAKLTEQRRALRAMATLNSPPAGRPEAPTQAEADALTDALHDSGSDASPAAAASALPAAQAEVDELRPGAAASGASALAPSRQIAGQMVVAPPEAPVSPGSTSRPEHLDGLRLVTGSSSLLISPDPRSMRHGSDPATAFALDEMTAAMRGVASALMGLQHEQEAIVDLLIAVLADDDEDGSGGV